MHLDANETIDKKATKTKTKIIEKIRNKHTCLKKEDILQCEFTPFLGAKKPLRNIEVCFVGYILADMRGKSC